MPRPSSSSAAKAVIKNRNLVICGASVLFILIFFLSLGSDSSPPTSSSSDENRRRHYENRRNNHNNNKNDNNNNNKEKNNDDVLDRGNEDHDHNHHHHHHAGFGGLIFKDGYDDDDDVEDEKDKNKGHPSSPSTSTVSSSSQTSQQQPPPSSSSSSTSTTTTNSNNGTTSSSSTTTAISNNIQNQHLKNVAILLARTNAECSQASELTKLSSVPFRHWMIVGINVDCPIEPITTSSIKRVEVTTCHDTNNNNQNNNNNQERKFLAGVSTCVNLAVSQIVSAVASNSNQESNNNIDWLFLVQAWPQGIEKKSLRNLMMSAGDVGVVQSSDFSNAAFMLHYSKLLRAKVIKKDAIYDENMISLSGDMFCTECSDLVWRANLNHLSRTLLAEKYQKQQINNGVAVAAAAAASDNNDRSVGVAGVAGTLLEELLLTSQTRRRVIRDALVGNPDPKKFLPAPRTYHHNMDYLMQKWGHVFHYELVLSRPPSGYLYPFNQTSSSSLTLDDKNPEMIIFNFNNWKLDVDRRVCFIQKMHLSPVEDIGKQNWCWYTHPDDKNNVVQHPPIRPSWYYKKDVERQKITAGTPLPPLATNPKEESSENLPDWLKAIKAAVIRGQNSNPADTLPALVSLLYTDCDFQRTMLGSIDVPLKRLIIAWNGHDSCAQQTVAYLRYHLPPSSVAVVFFPHNRGFAAGFNAGFQLAIAEAAKHNEEPPRWAIVSNGDIKYDKTLQGFVHFANRELSRETTDAAFFFGGGVSFCTVGTSLLVVERAGFLDENFFPSYNEDIDYMWRGHLAGLQNKHDHKYKFDHRNGGSYHGKNRTLVDLYISRFTRGNTKEFCHAKWGDCEGVKVWSHLPPSGWRTPFKAIGVPASYWTHDTRRIDCINGKGGPTYVGDAACWFDGTTLLDEFPDAVLPRHVVAPPRGLASKDVLGKEIVYVDISTEIPDTVKLLKTPTKITPTGNNNNNNGNQNHNELIAILGVFTSSSYSNFKSLLKHLGERQQVSTRLIIGVHSQDKNNNNKENKLPVDQLRNHLERTYPLQVSIGSLTGSGIAQSFNVGLSKIRKMNKLHQQHQSQEEGKSGDGGGWILLFAESRNVRVDTIENLVFEASKVFQEKQEALQKANTKSQRKAILETASPVLVVSDEYNLVVFLVHTSLLERIGDFDENFASQPDDSAHLFCGECVDFWWRASLSSSSSLTRRVAFHSRIIPFARHWYPTPSWYIADVDELCSSAGFHATKNVADYLAQKWGGPIFQHQLTWNLPPSGWIRPFNCSAIQLSDWRKISSSRKTNNNNNNNCWIDVEKVYELKNPLIEFDSPLSKSLFVPSSSTTTSSSSLLRPSQFLLRYLENNPVEEELNLMSPQTQNLLLQHKNKVGSGTSSQDQTSTITNDLLTKHNSWLPNIIKRIKQGHHESEEGQSSSSVSSSFQTTTPGSPSSVIESQNGATSFMMFNKKQKTVVQSFVAITFTDCHLLRKMLGTANVAIRRLHIVWSGDDETCAAETMTILRKFISPKFLQIIHLYESRGVAGAYNAGFRSALSSASHFNEPLPRYVFFTHSDITYDDTFPNFIDFIDTEYRNHNIRQSDAAFFFSGATSLCSVGISTNAFDRAGLFDENFFPGGYQDNDFIWRVHMAGLENKHDMRYKIHHVNAGAMQGANHRILKQYTSEKRRADPIQYCHAKWGDCEGFKVWEHFPPSEFRNPFNASGIPFSYWKLDEERRDCIVGSGGKKFEQQQQQLIGSITHQHNHNSSATRNHHQQHRYTTLQLEASVAHAKLATYAVYRGTQSCAYSGDSLLSPSLSTDSSSSSSSYSLLPQYPTAVLPLQIIGNQHISPSSEIGPAPKFKKVQFDAKKSFGHLRIGENNAESNNLDTRHGWSQDTIASLFGTSSSSSSSAKFILVSHIPSDPLCHQLDVIPKLASALFNHNNNNNNITTSTSISSQTYQLHFDRFLISSSSSKHHSTTTSTAQQKRSKCSAKLQHTMHSNSMKNFGVILSEHEDTHTNNKNAEDTPHEFEKQNHESISKVLNKAYEQYKSLLSSTKKDDAAEEEFWLIVVMKWNIVIPSSIVKLMEFIDATTKRHQYPYSENLDKNVGIIIGSDFEIGSVFAVSSRVFENVGKFDENLNSLEGGGNFCLECVDLSWRMELLRLRSVSSSSSSPFSLLRRKVLPFNLVRHSKAYLPTPFWYPDNADYFMQKWGHAFQFELNLPKPPSGWTIPFNLSMNGKLLTSWKIDEARRICAEETPVIEESFCWFDVVKTYSISADDAEKLEEANRQRPLIRPSWWFLRQAAPSNGSPLPPLSPKLQEEKDKQHPPKLPDWLTSIITVLQQGRDMKYDSTNSSSFAKTLPAMISLLYTDCDLQRSMMGSIQTPLTRLVIAWNGDDSCAAETVSYLRLYAPKNSIGYVFYPSNKGFSAAFNGGWRVALADAAKNNEEPPKWAIVTNGDIKYDKTLANFVKFAGNEVSHADSDACFFFGPGVSFCTVGMSLETVHRAGFLDENFFPSYNEDIDYMWRTHLNGMHNKHEMTYKFDHVNGGTYKGKNQKLVSSYVSRFHRGNTKEQCHSKWHDCEGTKVWLNTPPTGWIHPYNSSGIPYSYWKLDVARWRCINKDSDANKEKNRFYLGSEVCWYNTSVMLEDFPDFVPAPHARWQEGPVGLPSVRFKRRNS